MSKLAGVYFNVWRKPDGTWHSSIKFQTSPRGDAITVSGCCMGSWYDAVKKTTGKTAHLLKNPKTAAALTAIAPFVPGGLGAITALTVISAVSNAGKKGALKQLAPKFEDATLKQLATGVQKVAEGKASSLPGGPLLLVEPDHESKAMMGAIHEYEDEQFAQMLKRAKHAIEWGRKKAKTPEAKELVSRAIEQYRALKGGA